MVDIIACSDFYQANFGKNGLHKIYIYQSRFFIFLSCLIEILLPFNAWFNQTLVDRLLQLCGNLQIIDITETFLDFFLFINSSMV